MGARIFANLAVAALLVRSRNMETRMSLLEFFTNRPACE
jgi:hypothetical protein